VEKKRYNDELASSDFAYEASDVYGSALEDRLEKGEVPKAKFCSKQGTCLTKGLNGLARFDLYAEDVRLLSMFHELIKDRLGRNLNGWGGVGDKSGRRRGYGYFESSLGEEHFANGVVMKEYSGSEVELDKNANQRASILLTEEDLEEAAMASPEAHASNKKRMKGQQGQDEVGIRGAISRLAASLQAKVPPQYSQFLTLENLVAAQPNIHGGNAYLPPHLDEPLHDGFGIVIVTIAITGKAHIILQTDSWDSVKKKDFCFRLKEGQGYLLSGDSRSDLES